MQSSVVDHWFWELVGLSALQTDPLVGTTALQFNREALLLYQRYMVEAVKGKPILFLAAEMGLGKTVAVLTALSDLLATGEARPPILVVAPLLVAQETWPREIDKWEHTRHLTWTLIRAEDGDPDVEEACRVAGRGARALAKVEGHDTATATKLSASASARTRAVVKDRIRRQKRQEKTDLHIINRELLPWLLKTVKVGWPYKMIVYDEASRLKGGKKRTAAATKLKKDGTLGVGRRLSEFGTLSMVRPLLDRVVELSGTPAPNGLIDLWGPTYILDHGARLGRSMTAFKDRWFDEDHYEHTIEPKPHAFGEIMGALSDVMISLKEKDYLDLPPRIDNPIYVTLPPEIMQAYRAFRKTLYLEMHGIEAVNMGVLTNKLLQFANGSVYDENSVGRYVHDLKIKALESIVQEAAGAPVLVAYEFKFDLVAIRKRWPKAVLIGEKGWLDNWNAGKIRMLLCHPASAGHGLNLQFGGHIGVWFGLTWSLELYQQFIKRLDRQGQRFIVMMHHILARGTADEHVWEVAKDKGATQDEITDAVRVYLNG